MFFWFLYFSSLFTSCFLFFNIFKNKYVVYLIIPVFLALFGSIWFVEPGGNNTAPIISIFLMELAFVESNGFYRLLRPFISFLFFFEILTLIFFFILNNRIKKKLF